MRIFLVILWALLLLLLLFSLPVRVRFSARASLRVCRIRLETRVLGLLPVRKTFRLHLLSEPYLTLLLFDKKRGFRRIPLTGGGGGKTDVRAFLRFDAVHATYVVGVEDDAAATAFACGALSTAGDIALGRVFLQVRSSKAPVFDRSILRINLAGIVTLKPAKSIGILLRKK